MIELKNSGLAPAALSQLAAFQSVVDQQNSYEEMVVEAKSLFGRRNNKSNPTFRAVRRALTEMCSGVKRCGYCEDSAADEVEHIWPKNLYPSLAFEWANYLYACGPCNGPKNDLFAVFSTGPSGGPERVDVARSPGDPIVPPVSGPPLLIDPRIENPLDFMELDLGGTFLFVESHPPGSTEFERAQYTIEVLHLNDRDSLPRAREAGYRAFRALLFEYAHTWGGSHNRAAEAETCRAMSAQPHRTVWEEMKRQRSRHPGLSALFGLAPEARNWTFS